MDDEIWQLMKLQQLKMEKKIKGFINAFGNLAKWKWGNVDKTMQCRFWHKECCQTFLHILESPIVCISLGFLYIFVVVYRFICRCSSLVQIFVFVLYLCKSPIVCISCVHLIKFVLFCAKSLRESCQTSFISVKAQLFVSPSHPADYYLSSCALFSETPHNYLPFSPQPSFRKVSTIQKWV